MQKFKLIFFLDLSGDKNFNSLGTVFHPALYIDW